MSLLEKGAQHFAERRKLEKIHVDELDADIYYYPAMNMAERREIYKHQYQDGKFDLEGLVIALIVRARDAEGNKLFNKPDRLRLMGEWDGNLISKIVRQMETPEADSKGAEKNS